MKSVVLFAFFLNFVSAQIVFANSQQTTLSNSSSKTGAVTLGQQVFAVPGVGPNFVPVDCVAGEPNPYACFCELKAKNQGSAAGTLHSFKINGSIDVTFRANVYNCCNPTSGCHVFHFRSPDEYFVSTDPKLAFIPPSPYHRGECNVVGTEDLPAGVLPASYTHYFLGNWSEPTNLSLSPGAVGTQRFSRLSNAFFPLLSMNSCHIKISVQTPTNGSDGALSPQVGFSPSW